MYHIKDAQTTVSVTPKQLNSHLRESLHTLLEEKVAGSVLSSFRKDIEYVHSVLGMNSVHDGSVGYAGDVAFTVSFFAHTYTLHKDDTVDSTVVTVTSHGVLCKVGPVDIFVSVRGIPVGYIYHADNTVKEFTTKDKILKIRVGMSLRVKILEVKWGGSEIFAVGTLLGDGLGPLEYIP